MRTLALCLLLLVPGCGSYTTAGGDVVLTTTQLKYELDEAFTIFFCDPDYYPISRDDEDEKAIERYPVIAADTEKLGAILAHLGWASRTDFTPSEKLAIYREDKRLASITLEAGGTAYAFSLRDGTEQSATTVTGTITRTGRISVRQRTPSPGGCPICLDVDTRIATPAGDMAVGELEPGMRVWSESPEGIRIAVTIRRVGHTPIPAGHEFVHLELSDGRALRASPGHPVEDGRLVGDLRAGDALDGAHVVAAGRHAAAGTATYDLLPGGLTGVYWANGIPLRSTLSRALLAARGKRTTLHQGTFLSAGTGVRWVGSASRRVSSWRSVSAKPEPR